MAGLTAPELIAVLTSENNNSRQCFIPEYYAPVTR